MLMIIYLMIVSSFIEKRQRIIFDYFYVIGACLFYSKITKTISIIDNQNCNNMSIDLKNSR